MFILLQMDSYLVTWDGIEGLILRVLYLEYRTVLI